MPLEAGLRAMVPAVVTAADTSVALGSGDVEVLGTPRALALAEAASVLAVAGALGEGQTTVGVHVDLAHLSATAVGAEVEAEAELLGIDGRRLVFRVAVHEGAQIVAEGRVTRVIVDRVAFGPRSSST